VLGFFLLLVVGVCVGGVLCWWGSVWFLVIFVGVDFWVVLWVLGCGLVGLFGWWFCVVWAGWFWVWCFGLRVMVWWGCVLDVWLRGILGYSGCCGWVFGCVFLLVLFFVWCCWFFVLVGVLFVGFSVGGGSCWGVFCLVGCFWFFGWLGGFSFFVVFSLGFVFCFVLVFYVFSGFCVGCGFGLCGCVLVWLWVFVWLWCVVLLWFVFFG